MRLVLGVILVTFWWHVGQFFVLFGTLVAKWDPGPKNLEKGTPKTKQKYSIFARFQCFGVDVFSWFFWSLFGHLFSDFGTQSVPNEGPVGPHFPTCCRKVGMVKTMVLCRPNITFHALWGLGLETVGNFFQGVFQTGSGHVILWFFVRLGLQPGTQITHIWHNFRYKLKVEFLMIFRRPRGDWRARKVAPRGTSLKLLS